MVCVCGNCCGNAENLNVPKPLWTGTGALRQEFLINSCLSAPQAPGWQPCACPVRRGFGTSRFSRISADAAAHAHHPPASSRRLPCLSVLWLALGGGSEKVIEAYVASYTS